MGKNLNFFWVLLLSIWLPGNILVLQRPLKERKKEKIGKDWQPGSDKCHLKFFFFLKDWQPLIIDPWKLVTMQIRHTAITPPPSVK